jgi:hypothetical protein
VETRTFIVSNLVRELSSLFSWAVLKEVERFCLGVMFYSRSLVPISGFAPATVYSEVGVFLCPILFYLE